MEITGFLKIMLFVVYSHWILGAILDDITMICRPLNNFEITEKLCLHKKKLVCETKININEVKNHLISFLLAF